ncbi:MAG: hypothetical protein LBR68_03670 [Lachnoclostridium sp.]|jgi:hypothetical protein|nr:hypothetical protein [Lachnoclostridium sp.]
MKANIINELAKKYGVSTHEIESDMQKAINLAYKMPNEEAKKISSADEIPTPDEVAEYVMVRLK